MKYNEIIANIRITLKYLIPTLSTVYKPISHIHCSLKRTTVELFTNIVLYGVISAIAVLFVTAQFSTVFKFNLIPVLSGRIVILSVIFVPISFSILLFEKVKIQKKIIASFYLSVTFICFYVVPIVFLFIIFLYTENYLFYYGYILLILVVCLLYAICIPLFYHKGKKRILGLLLTLIFYIGTNYLTFCVMELFDKDLLKYNSFDPIYIEFQENNILESTKFQYLDSIYQLIQPMIGNVPTEKEIELVLNQMESLDHLESSLNSLISRLTFETNKKFISNSLMRISGLKQIKVQLLRMKYVPDSISKDIEVQEKKLNVLIENANKIQLIINKVNKSSDDSVLTISQSDYADLKQLLGIPANEELSENSINVSIAKLKNIYDEIQKISEQVAQVGINASALHEINSIMSVMIETMKEMNIHLEYWNGIFRMKEKFPIFA